MDNAATSIDNDASSTASVAGKTGKGKMSSLLTRIRALEEFGFTDSMVKKRARNNGYEEKLIVSGWDFIFSHSKTKQPTRKLFERIIKLGVESDSQLNTNNRH